MEGEGATVDLGDIEMAPPMVRMTTNQRAQEVLRGRRKAQFKASLRDKLQRDRWCGRLVAKHMGWFAAGSVTLWMTSCMLFYHRFNHWSWTVSFYYATQAGLSVGFGAMSEEVNNLTCTGVPRPQHEQMISKLYTTAHVLLGASFVAAGQRTKHRGERPCFQTAAIVPRHLAI